MIDERRWHRSSGGHLFSQIWLRGGGAAGLVESARAGVAGEIGRAGGPARHRLGAGGLESTQTNPLVGKQLLQLLPVGVQTRHITSLEFSGDFDPPVLQAETEGKFGLSVRPKHHVHGVRLGAPDIHCPIGEESLNGFQRGRRADPR